MYENLNIDFAWTCWVNVTVFYTSDLCSHQSPVSRYWAHSTKSVIQLCWKLDYRSICRNRTAFSATHTTVLTALTDNYTVRTGICVKNSKLYTYHESLVMEIVLVTWCYQSCITGSKSCEGRKVFEAGVCHCHEVMWPVSCVWKQCYQTTE